MCFCIHAATLSLRALRLSLYELPLDALVACASSEELALKPFLLLPSDVKDEAVLVEASADETFKPLNMFFEAGVKLESPVRGLMESALAAKPDLLLLFNPANPENPWKTPPP